jgi:hypothetical protein
VKNERPQPKAGGAVGDAAQHHSTSLPAEITDHPELADGLHSAIAMLAFALQELVRLLPELKAAIDRQADSKAKVDRLTYRLDELAAALGVSRRVLERERAAGRVPQPNLYVGKMPLFCVDTIVDWLKKHGR